MIKMYTIYQFIVINYVINEFGYQLPVIFVGSTKINVYSYIYGMYLYNQTK